MKKPIFLFIFLLAGFVGSGQATKSVAYSDILAGKKFTDLPLNGVLIVTQVPATMQKVLTLTYHYGISINGDYVAQSKTKSFKLPGDIDTLMISSSPGQFYKIPIRSNSPESNVINNKDNTNITITKDGLTSTPTAYLDAIKLFNYLKSSGDSLDKSILEKILVNYISDADLKSKYSNDYSNWIKLNPFLKAKFSNEKFVLFKKLNKENIAKPADLQNASGLSLINTIGGLDVTQYVQAFADFLKDRIKQELTIAYLQKFKDALNSNKAIQELLPKTWQTFKSNDIFNLPSMGAIYKDALSDDLAHLTENFQAYIYKYLFIDFSKEQKEAFIISCAMYSFIDLSAKGYPPSDILNSLSRTYSFNDNRLKSTFMLGVLDMFQQNLKTEKGNSWISKSDFQFNPNLLSLFFALLDDKYNVIFTDTSILENHSLEGLLLSVDFQTDKIYQFLMLANHIDDRINELKKSLSNLSQTEKKQRTMELFLDNAGTMTDLLKFALSFDKSGEFSKSNIQIASAAQNTILIATAVHGNNFAKASNGAVSLIESILPSKEDSVWIVRLKEILVFITDIVNADSSVKIKAVLEHYAAPVQSYLTIRQSVSSVTLGAYPGFYLGTELNGHAGISLFSNCALGVTAPLGLAFNFGAKNKSKYGSNTVFLSMIDIGAALSYRWNNDTADIPSKITLAQIFAPGVHYIYGFRDSPLTLKVGYQYCPELRKIKTDQNLVNNAGVWRLSASLCVDIPVFIFSSKRNNN